VNRESRGIHEVLRDKTIKQLTNLSIKKMQLNTVIFDMDGLLIDSEPLWQEAAEEVFALYNFKLTLAQYETSTGLRTKEFVDYWFKMFNIDAQYSPDAEKKIIEVVTHKIMHKGRIMPGVHYIFNFFESLNFRIGIASSSPKELIDIVIEMAEIGHQVHAVSSAQELPYGKPHPQVYLDCASLLKTSPEECLCFEDSFNGMIAAKAAKMKCVVVPSSSQSNSKKWGAADLQLSSLQNFGKLLYESLS